MGVHEFGKRSKSGRPVITRKVPAIVTEEVWKKAQATLRSNFLFGQRSARNKYLLRGLIKCEKCGLTYIGVAANRPNGKREFYYRCNGAHSPAVYIGHGGRCGSKSVRGDLLEKQVWSDVETFLRNPEPVLQRLQQRLEADVQGTDQVRTQMKQLEGLLEQKATERSRMVALYRRNRLTEADLDTQMEEIGKEQTALEAQIEELRAKLAGTRSVGESVTSADSLLKKLRKRLDGPISWELKRRLIETLVAGVRVETTETFGVKQTEITVTYRFTEPDQPMPVVLPQSYSAGTVVRIPVEPQTIGDHLRRKRLARKILQREVAEQIGVTTSCIFNWESNAARPDIRYMPAIIRFLGYDPLPEPQNCGERLVWRRTSLGLSQKAAAKQLGVDSGTLARWERGEREPTGSFLVLVQRFVGDAGAALAARTA
jgi:transcriptional regulator with XRE-family HTH domain